ncbi:AMP-binding protein [Verticiella sediminum]|nr:AMP-binding protein [Verticiella sediminum]
MTSPIVPNVGALVARAARWYARHPAILTDDGRSISYAELEQRSNRLGNALLGMGLSAGERVAVYLPNRPEIVELELACYKAALVKAPINSRLSAQETAAVLANSEARVLLTTPERADDVLPLLDSPAPMLLLVDAPEHHPAAYERVLAAAGERLVAAEVRADDLAVLHYTSGSTGTLKAAMQTFGNRLAQMRKFLLRSDGMRPGERIGLVGPITHASGMQIVPTLCSGATVRLFRGFEPARYLDGMRRDRVTHTFLVPTMINMLLGELQGRYLPLPDLKRLGYGAAPMAPARIQQAMDVFGPVLAQGYGAGETTSGVCALSVEDHLYARAARPELLSSCGRPLLECDVRIVDDAGQEVPTGELGEIVVSGPDVFAGYWRAPALSAEVLKNGRYHTGDVARMDDEGYVYIVDRKKDMVITGGFNVYPTEVEAVLYRHPAVADACVFAVPDEKWGEAVAAHVVLKPGIAPEAAELDSFCAQHLGGFKRPRLVEFVEALPKNANGKVARKTIQDHYWQGHARRVN